MLCLLQVAKSATTSTPFYLAVYGGLIAIVSGSSSSLCLTGCYVALQLYKAKSSYICVSQRSYQSVSFIFFSISLPTTLVILVCSAQLTCEISVLFDRKVYAIRLLVSFCVASVYQIYGSSEYLIPAQTCVHLCSIFVSTHFMFVCINSIHAYLCVSIVCDSYLQHGGIRHSQRQGYSTLTCYHY